MYPHTYFVIFSDSFVYLFFNIRLFVKKSVLIEKQLVDRHLVDFQHQLVDQMTRSWLRVSTKHWACQMSVDQIVFDQMTRQPKTLYFRFPPAAESMKAGGERVDDLKGRRHDFSSHIYFYKKTAAILAEFDERLKRIKLHRR